MEVENVVATLAAVTMIVNIAKMVIPAMLRRMGGDDDGGGGRCDIDDEKSRKGMQKKGHRRNMSLFARGRD